MTLYQLFSNITQLVSRMCEIYPNLKFILSEVTPRMDEFDKRVKEANVLLGQYTQGNDHIFLVRNSNLRNPDNFFRDGKHLKHEIIPRFASNIKRALRAAYGIKFERNNYKRQEHQQRRESFTSERNTSPHQQKYPTNDALIQMIRQEMLDRITRAFGT